MRARALVAVAVVAALSWCASASAHTDDERQLEFLWPAQGTITSPFGNDNGRWHPGLDIGILRSLEIDAAAPGLVTRVGTPRGFEGYGNVVVVRVAPEIETLYAHLSSESVRKGDYVIAGEQLGVAGCTGWCTGTHLHFEVRQSGVAVSPWRWLS